LKASGEDGSSFRADLEQSIQIKPVYEIRNAQNRAAVPDGVVCCSHWTKVPYADTAKPAKISDEKTEKLRYDKINPDPYAKRTAGRVAATSALQSNPVGPASRTTQARACRLVE